MALINCPECGKQISDKALTCIHCGFPLDIIVKDDLIELIEQIDEEEEYKNKSLDELNKFSIYAFGLDNVLLECEKCARIDEYNVENVFSEISEEECILSEDISCSNCGNSVKRGEKIYPKQIHQIMENSTEMSYKSFNSNNEVDKNEIKEKKNDSGNGCLLYLIFVIVVIIGGIWFLVDSFDGFHFGVIFAYIIAVLVCSSLLYVLFTTDSKEFKENTNRQKYNDYKYTCPMCGSKKVKRISNMNRATSVATMGLASSKIGKQYECDDCKHKW